MLRRVDKADAATMAFACAGLAGWLLPGVRPSDTPLALFYAVLLVNTRCSIAFYAGIIPRKARGQQGFDSALALFYFALGFALHRPVAFATITCLLFLVASLKYVALLGTVPYPSTLIRKIRIDLCGAVLGACVAGGMLMGQVMHAAWALALAFTLANLYLLAVDPMYRILDGDLCAAGCEDQPG